MPFHTSRIGWLVFVCFEWVLYTPGLIPAELGQLANLRHVSLSDNQLKGTSSLLPSDLHSIWRNMTHIQYEGTCWLSLCPFIPVRWRDLIFVCFELGFVHPRSHSGWIGPIGEIGATVLAAEQAYRYSILLPPDLPSILRHGLALLSKIVPVG